MFDCWKKQIQSITYTKWTIYNPYIHEITKSLIVFIVNIVIKYLLNCTELSSSHLRSVGRRYNSGVNVSCLLPLEHRIQLCVHSGSFANWITWSLHTHDALLLTVVAASVHHLRIGARDELVFRTAVVLATDPHRGAPHETEGRDLWTGGYIAKGSQQKTQKDASLENHFICDELTFYFAVIQNCV